MTNRRKLLALSIALLAGASIGYAVDTALTTSAPTYWSATAYTRTPPPFTPQRTVNVRSAPQLERAISNLRGGDLVRATASFSVSSTTGPALVIKDRLAGLAVIDLRGHRVTFVYSGGKNYSAVYLNNVENLRIYGGDLSTADTGGPCLTSYGGQHLTWWYLSAHDCGGSGAFISTVTGPSEHNDFNATIWKVGQNLKWDPHPEKGTGLHCVNLDDSKSGRPFQDNRFAFYCHDIPTGAAVEYGEKPSGSPPVDNTIYLLAKGLTEVAKYQTGGNGIQFWGVAGQSAVIRFVQVDNAQGYALWDGGMASGARLNGITVDYGRASKTNLNPRYAGQNPWSGRLGEAYRNVLPRPAPGKP